MPVLPYLQHVPHVGDDLRLADDAVIVGKVTLAGPAMIEARAVLRGDQNQISIGPRFRIGRRSTIHVEEHSATSIGQDVWVGDDAVVHACTLGDGVRVEDGGLVLSGASVGPGSIVAADSLVPEGVCFPANSYISGAPGRRVRDTTVEERESTVTSVAEALSH